MSEDTNYGLDAEVSVKELPAPDLDYKPPFPKTYRPGIGMIGCGGITVNHLTAYKQDGLKVIGLCDLNEGATEERRKEFYPEATCYTDYNELLADEKIQVVDIALHPAPRAATIEAALNAGKHVLSQKPFALDLRLPLR